MELTNKTIVITGGSQGLGEVLSFKLAQGCFQNDVNDVNFEQSLMIQISELLKVVKLNV